jgi:hypothetical protein
MELSMGRVINIGKKGIKRLVVFAYKIAYKKKMFKLLARPVKRYFPGISIRIQRIVALSSGLDIVNSELRRERFSRTGWSVYEELAAEIKKIKKGR